MKRVTIYVDDKIWEGVKECAWKKRFSAGNYLIGLHEKYGNMPDEVSYSPGPIDKAIKKKATKSDWVNPLEGTSRAPR